MKKIILVDGNNLLFRSYYATAYSGQILRNSKGFPTNALYGFISMINKIIKEENPVYMAVAFDIGKNFRKEKYDFYKEGRQKTPDELVAQMPYARKILGAMGIPYFELAPYEADDIIGTIARRVEESSEYEGTIISSDRDLLQLINDKLDMKLLKQHDYIRYNKETFFNEYGVYPINVIDEKALAGDSSDNIPGVAGIGEKGAYKLLKEFGPTLEEVYNNIDNIKGKTKEKLINDKENAFMSKEIATIFCEVPLSIELEDLKITSPHKEDLDNLYEELEFYSLLNGHKEATKKDIDVIKIKDAFEIEESSEYSIYIECDKENYHLANILGLSISTKDKDYFVEPSLIASALDRIRDNVIYTFDYKKLIVLLHNNDIKRVECNTDLQVIYALEDDGSVDDIAVYLSKKDSTLVTSLDDIYKGKYELDTLIKEMCLKSRFIFEKRDRAILDLKRDDMYELFTDIEMPLVSVLADMEIEGIKCDKNILKSMQEEYKIKLSELEKEIYAIAGIEFNISSPKQLGEVLFDRLMIPAPKKKQSGYSTDAKTLKKVEKYSPIIPLIMEYRNASKLYSTYIEGLQNYILPDNKIHTIFKQNFARTGRLSSTEPNLQNIPVRDAEGKKIREAFLPSNDLFLSMDYSQVELRILAHISGEQGLIRSFNNNEDIHTRVASEIYGIPMEDVTKDQRRVAKSVIFGIVYGISGYGLGENLLISPKEAKEFIEKYYSLYPKVKEYMDNIAEEASSEGVVRTLFNRRRVIPELSSSNYMVREAGKRIALNTPIQGTSADIIKKAMVEISKSFKLNNIKSKMVLQIHDELIFDILEEEKDIVTNIVSDVMTNVVKLSVPLVTSCDVASNWYLVK